MFIVYLSLCLEFQPPHAASDSTFTSINSLASIANSIHWIPVIHIFTFLLGKTNFLSFRWKKYICFLRSEILLLLSLEDAWFCWPLRFHRNKNSWLCWLYVLSMTQVNVLPVFTSYGLVYVSKHSKPNHYNTCLDFSSSQDLPLLIFHIFIYFLQLHPQIWKFPG